MIRDNYLYQRAEAELKMATLATVPEAAKRHYELANFYLDRFYNADGSMPEARPAPAR